MFYLIQRKSGKIAAEAESKGTLRRQQKTMKNPSAYSISKYKTIAEGKENRGRPAAAKKVKKVKDKNKKKRLRVKTN